MVNIYLNPNLTSEEKRTSIFDGNLLLYACDASSKELVDHATSMIAEALAPHDPERAQFSLPVENFIQRIGALKTKFTNDARTKVLIRALLSAQGHDLLDTYFDVPRLRVVPHGDYLTSGVSYAYKAHRDIWYSSPTAQLNWWMPVFSIAANRAMSFFPEYWTKKVPNSSAEFDYSEWCNVGRQLATSQVGKDTRKHPLPNEPVNVESELRIAGSPGDLIVFSSSHLHATAENTSGLTRFSIDFRTISLADLESKRGAPNIDSKAQGSTIGDFLRASDFQSISLSKAFFNAPNAETKI
jgi:hypothetical protein